MFKQSMPVRQPTEEQIQKLREQQFFNVPGLEDKLPYSNKTPIKNILNEHGLLPFSFPVFVAGDPSRVFRVDIGEGEKDYYVVHYERAKVSQAKGSKGEPKPGTGSITLIDPATSKVVTLQGFEEYRPLFKHEENEKMREQVAEKTEQTAGKLNDKVEKMREIQAPRPMQNRPLELQWAKRIIEERIQELDNQLNALKQQEQERQEKDISEWQSYEESLSQGQEGESEQDIFENILFQYRYDMDGLLNVVDSLPISDNVKQALKQVAEVEKEAKQRYDEQQAEKITRLEEQKQKMRLEREERMKAGEPPYILPSKVAPPSSTREGFPGKLEKYKGPHTWQKQPSEKIKEIERNKQELIECYNALTDIQKVIKDTKVTKEYLTQTEEGQQAIREMHDFLQTAHRFLDRYYTDILKYNAKEDIFEINPNLFGIHGQAGNVEAIMALSGVLNTLELGLRQYGLREAIQGLPISTASSVNWYRRTLKY